LCCDVNADKVHLELKPTIEINVSSTCMPGNRKRKGKRSENVATAKKAKISINPFEVRRNRQKHEVIGQKSARDGTGRPGLSRSKAIDKVGTHYGDDIRI